MTAWTVPIRITFLSFCYSSTAGVKDSSSKLGSYKAIKLEGKLGAGDLVGGAWDSIA